MPRWAVIAIVVATGLAAIWIKVRVESGVSHDRALALEAEQDWALAITVHRQAVRWYSPGSGPVEASLARLEALATEREAAGDPGHALMAWRALRSGLYGVRSLYQPYSDRIPPAEDAIARLMAAQQAPEDAEKRAALTAHHRALLERDLAPNTWWSLLAVLAFFGWAGGLFMFAFVGFDDETGALVRPAAGRWAAVCLVTMVLWMAGLSQA